MKVGAQLNNMANIKRDRIRVAVFAYCYEILNISLISDHEYDILAKNVLDSVAESTGNEKYDTFFKTHYVDYSGIWIRKHPDFSNGILDKLSKYVINISEK